MAPWIASSRSKYKPLQPPPQQQNKQQEQQLQYIVGVYVCPDQLCQR